MRNWFAVDILLSTLVSAVPVSAQSASTQSASTERSMATQLFDDAQVLWRSGNVSDACPKLAESQRLDPQLGTLLNLGGCYEAVGKTATAWACFKDAVEIAAARHDPREEKARKHLAGLEKSLSRLSISVTPSALENLVVSLDGAVVGKAAWGEAVPVDPGRHKLTAKAPGYVAWSSSVDVSTSADTVRITVPALSPENAYSDSAPARASSFPVLGYALGGVGVVGIALGTVLLVERGSKLSDRDSVCPARQHCTSSDQAEVDSLTQSARTATTGAIASYAIGGAALVGAVAAVLATRSKPSTVTVGGAEANVRPWIAANGAGAVIGGRW
jgi:hypothetical protein